jgi:hypothetical protein
VGKHPREMLPMLHTGTSMGLCSNRGSALITERKIEIKKDLRLNRVTLL